MLKTGGAALALGASLVFIGYLASFFEGKESESSKGQQFASRKKHQHGRRGAEEANDPDEEGLGAFMAAEQARQNGNLAQAEIFFKLAASKFVTLEFKVNTLIRLADIAKKRKDIAGAEKWLRECLDIFESGEVPETSRVLSNHAETLAALADIEDEKKNYEEAEELLERSLDVLESRRQVIDVEYASNAEERAEAMRNLDLQFGIFWDTMSKFKLRKKDNVSAEEFCRKAIQALQTWGITELLVRAQIRLGTILLKKGQMAEGNEVFRQMVDKLPSDAGKGLFNTFFASANYSAKNYEKAIEYYQIAAGIFKDLKDMQWNYCDCLNQIAEIEREIGREDRADEIIKQVLSLVVENRLKPPASYSFYFNTSSPAIKKGNSETLLFCEAKLALQEGEKIPPSTIRASLHFPTAAEPLLFQQSIEENQSWPLVLRSPDFSADMTKSDAPILCKISVFNDKDQFIAAHHLIFVADDFSKVDASEEHRTIPSELEEHEGGFEAIEHDMEEGVTIDPSKFHEFFDGVDYEEGGEYEEGEEGEEEEGARVEEVTDN